MSLEGKLKEARAAFEKDGLSAVRPLLQAEGDARAWMYGALLCTSKGDVSGAAECASAAAAADPSSRLFRHVADHTAHATAQGQGVYAASAAFSAFCGGGGNVALYKAVSAALCQTHADAAAAKKAGDAVRVLEVGVGNGLALLPALAQETAETRGRLRLTLVEPSAALLAETVAAVDAGAVDEAFAGTLQRFVSAPTSSERCWDVAEATFALQNVPHGEKRAVLAWLRAHAKTVVIAEFDADAAWAADPLEPASALRVLQLYERGVREFSDAPDGTEALVARGFLVPVLLGSACSTPATRTNFEQPTSAWVADSLQRGSPTSTCGASPTSGGRPAFSSSQSRCAPLR